MSYEHMTREQREHLMSLTAKLNTLLSDTLNHINSDVLFIKGGILILIPPDKITEDLLGIKGEVIPLMLTSFDEEEAYRILRMMLTYTPTTLAMDEHLDS